MIASKREGFLLGHTPREPGKYGGAGYAGQLDPLDQVTGLAVKGYKAIVTTVTGLLLGRGPATILRRVSLAIVNTIQASTVRTFSHILKEARELLPLLTDCYSTSSVVRVVLVSWIRAASFHRGPSTIGDIGPALRGMTVSSAAKACNLGSQAAARARYTPAEKDTLQDTQGPTFAAAEPLPLSSIVFHALHDGPSPERGPSEVEQLCHRSRSIITVIGFGPPVRARTVTEEE